MSPWDKVYWEKKFNCCGYKNVFDYCCSDEMSSIIPTYFLEYNMFQIEMEQRANKTVRRIKPQIIPKFSPMEEEFDDSSE